MPRRLRPRPPIREQPPELDADMTATDIVDALRRLEFFDRSQFIPVRIDQEIRDYLVDSLSARAARRP